MKKDKRWEYWMAVFTVASFALLFVAVKDKTEYYRADRSYKIESVQETIEGNEELNNPESMENGKNTISIDEEEAPQAASPQDGWATLQIQFVIIGIGLIMIVFGTYEFIIKRQAP